MKASYIAIVIYSACSAAYAGTLSTLHTFDNGYGGGGYPYSGVIIDGNGVLYGMASSYGAGSTGSGAIFSLTPPASPGGVWSEAAIISVTTNDVGIYIAGVTLGGDGRLFATASDPIFNCSRVFELSPPASPGASWAMGTLINKCTLFTERGVGPGTQDTAPVIGSNGALYIAGGPGTPSTCGSVFSVSPPVPPGTGIPWTETALYTH